jgi:hypothetical protein
MMKSLYGARTRNGIKIPNVCTRTPRAVDKELTTVLSHFKSATSMFFPEVKREPVILCFCCFLSPKSQQCLEALKCPKEKSFFLENT